MIEATTAIPVSSATIAAVALTMDCLRDRYDP